MTGVLFLTLAGILPQLRIFQQTICGCYLHFVITFLIFVLVGFVEKTMGCGIKVLRRILLYLSASFGQGVHEGGVVALRSVLSCFSILLQWVTVNVIGRWWGSGWCSGSGWGRARATILSFQRT